MKPKNNKKNIVFLKPSMLGGGAERVMSILVNSMSEYEEFKVFLVTLETGDEYELSRQINRVILSKVHGHASKTLKTIMFPYYFYNFLLFVLKNRPSSVIAFGDRTILLNILVSFITKHKVISTLRTHATQQFNNINPFWGGIYKNGFKLLLNKSYKIIVTSECAKDDLINNFNIDKDKVNVIYNSVNIEKITALADEEFPSSYRKFFENSRVIINVGRLSKEKNQAELIEMFWELSKKYDDLKLCILGYGPYENDLKEKVKNLGLENRVLFTGFQNNPFVFIQKSYIFAFPSLWEGFPNALVEAMACKLPVVAYDCESGPAEILLNNEYGFLVPFKNKNIFIEKLEGLLDNSKLYAKYSVLAFKRATEFTPEIFREKFKKVIDD